MKHYQPIDVPPPDHSTAFDPITTRAFQAFGRTVHLHKQAMQRRFANPGTHHGEVFALGLLAQHDGMSQSDLAERLHLSRSRVTSILQGLERMGAVRREADTIDQRVTRVFLTEEGRGRELEFRADFEDYLSKTIGALSEGDKEELARILDQVSGHISELICAATREQEGRGV